MRHERLLVGLIAILELLAPSSNASEPADTYSFLTNFPSIRTAVLSVQYFSERSVIVEYRYARGPKGRSMFARQLTDPLPEGRPFDTPAGTMCGNWGDNYWFLQPEAASPTRGRKPRPMLTIGVATGRDAEGLKHANLTFSMFLSYFASLGITADGVDSLRVDGNGVIRTAVPDSQGRSLEARMNFSNGLPIKCFIQPKVPGVPAKPIHVRYTYSKTNALPASIPNEIVVWQRVPLPGQPEDTDPGTNGIDRVFLRLTAEFVELANPAETEPKEWFLPKREWNASVMVYTNQEHYSVRGDGTFRLIR